MKTCAELAAWCIGAAERFGDPSVPVCQMFFRFLNEIPGRIPATPGNELVCWMEDGELVLLLGGVVCPLPITVGEFELDGDEQVAAYGLDAITPGLWAVSPSLNIEDSIHGFVVVHGVPDPAPWERRILLPP